MTTELDTKLAALDMATLVARYNEATGKTIKKFRTVADGRAALKKVLLAQAAEVPAEEPPAPEAKPAPKSGPTTENPLALRAGSHKGKVGQALLDAKGKEVELTKLSQIAYGTPDKVGILKAVLKGVKVAVEKYGKGQYTFALTKTTAQIAQG